MYGLLAALASDDQTSRAEGIAHTDLQKPSPAQINQSVRHDGIVSFIDGRTYKTLRRHLTKHGLHPQSYRERYGLPADYPMVAFEYAERRSKLAKRIGLGKPGGLAARGDRQAA